MNKYIKQIDKFLFDDFRKAIAEEDFTKFHLACLELLVLIVVAICCLFLVAALAYAMYNSPLIVGSVVFVVFITTVAPGILFRMMVARNNKNN